MNKMDALYVEQANPVTGAYERLLFRPIVRKATDETGVLLALMDAADGEMTAIADAFGKRTQARARGKVERFAKVVVVDFVEEK